MSSKLFLALATLTALVTARLDAAQIRANSLVVATSQGLVVIDPVSGASSLLLAGNFKEVAVAPDGVIHGSTGTSVVSIDPDGTLLAPLPQNFSSVTLLGIGPDGNVLLFDGNSDNVVRTRLGGSAVILNNPDVVSGADAPMGPDGLIYVADESQSVFTVLRSDGIVVREIDNVGVPISAAFDDRGTLLVVDAATDTILRIDPRSGQKTTLVPILVNRDLTRLAPGPDGLVYVGETTSKSVIVLAADGTVVRSIPIVVNANPVVPKDVAFVPFRFKAKLKAHVEGFAVDPPGNGGGNGGLLGDLQQKEIDKGTAVISIFPGSGDVFVAFDGIEGHVGDTLGTLGLTTSGVTASTSDADGTREFAGLQVLGFESAIRFASLALKENGKVTGAQQFFTPKKVSGELHVVDAGLVARVRVKSKQLLNP